MALKHQWKFTFPAETVREASEKLTTYHQAKADNYLAKYNAAIAELQSKGLTLKGIKPAQQMYALAEAAAPLRTVQQDVGRKVAVNEELSTAVDTAYHKWMQHLGQAIQYRNFMHGLAAALSHDPSASVELDVDDVGFFHLGGDMDQFVADQAEVDPVDPADA